MKMFCVNILRWGQGSGGRTYEALAIQESDVSSSSRVLFCIVGMDFVIHVGFP